MGVAYIAEEEFLIHILSGDVEVCKTDLGCFIYYKEVRILVVTLLGGWKSNSKKERRYMLNTVNVDWDFPREQKAGDLRELRSWLARAAKEVNTLSVVGSF